MMLDRGRGMSELAQEIQEWEADIGGPGEGSRNPHDASHMRFDLTGWVCNDLEMQPFQPHYWRFVEWAPGYMAAECAPCSVQEDWAYVQVCRRCLYLQAAEVQS